MGKKGEDIPRLISKKRNRSPVAEIRRLTPTGGRDGPLTPGNLSTGVSLPTLNNGGTFSNEYERVSRSVVTVASTVVGLPTFYGTGFVLLVDEHGRLVIQASALHYNKEEVKRTTYTILFKGGFRYDAMVVAWREGVEIILLLVRNMHQDHNVAPLLLSSHPPIEHEDVYTVGVMAGTKLNIKADFVGQMANQMVGDLGVYQGFVPTPSCASLNGKGKPISGTDCHFIFRCTFEDNTVELKDIDDPKHDAEHTCDRMLSAPIFRANGEVVGILSSRGNTPDMKIGSRASDVLVWINFMCGTKGDEWKAYLRKKMEKARWATPKLN